MADLPIAVLSSDWHGQRRAWQSRAIEGDAYYSIDQMFAYAEENQIPVLGAGDLADVNPPDPHTMRWLARRFEKFHNSVVDEVGFVYFITGQHERNQSEVPWFSVFPDAIPIHRRTYEIAGRQIYGIDWTPPSRLKGEIDLIPKHVDLVLLHQVCSEFMQVNQEVTLADIPGTFDIVVGDYHQTHLIQAGGHRVLSPGSLALQSIDEEPNKSFSVLYESGRIEHVPLKTRRIAHFEIFNQDDLDRFLADRPWEVLLAPYDVPDEIKTPLVSVTFKEIPQAEVRLREALDEHVHLFLQPVVERKAQVVRPVRSNAFTLAEAVAQAVPDDSLTANHLRRLFEAGAKHAPAELARIKQEFYSSFEVVS